MNQLHFFILLICTMFSLEAKNIVKIIKTKGLRCFTGNGFEIHYKGSKAVSGYHLKKGTRPSRPGGKYDGTYNEDFEHISGKGKLDKCNGGKLGDKYVYFITDSYPYVGRCLWGQVSADFGRNRH
jgi:hypothetical protein